MARVKFDRRPKYKAVASGKGKPKCKCGFRVRGLRQNHNRGTHHMKWLSAAVAGMSMMDKRTYAAGTEYAMDG